jgi:hypothetical protein
MGSDKGSDGGGAVAEVDLMRGILTVSLGLFLTIGAAARADYLGLSVEQHTTVNIADSTRDVYRVYANFSDPGDYMLAGAGSPMLGPMLIQSRNSDDTGTGSSFYNHPFVGNRAPSQEVIDVEPNAEWDSFFTIGVSIADQAPNGDQMYFSPGFPPLTGTSITTSNGGWLIVPGHPQAFADFSGDGDPLLRVMMIQLTVNAGGNVRGTVGLSFRLAGQGPSTEIGGQTFNSFPAPGGLAMIALAGVTRSPGRRRA